MQAALFRPFLCALKNSVIFLLTFLGLAVSVCTAESNNALQTQSGTPPVLEIALTFPAEFQGRNLRFGDLDGDQQADFLVVQNDGMQNILSLIAFKIDGTLLWIYGEPRANAFASPFDVAVQIYDWNSDGHNEVILVQNGQLLILNGATGEVQKSVAVPGEARDGMLIGHFFSQDPGADILIKNRYLSFWVLDHNLQIRTQQQVRTGHFGAAYDFDRDGQDELLIGYGLYKFGKSRGLKRLWIHDELPLHNDATDIADMDNDGIPEIAIAASRNGYLFNPDGRQIKKFKMKHAQHANIGHFLWDRPNEQQVAYVDRARNGVIKVFSKHADLHWKSKRLGHILMTNAVRGWTGHAKQDLIAAFRSDFQFPALYNGRGEMVVSFPFPINKAEGEHAQHYLQHFDIMGDCREEMIIYSEKELWIYSNGEPLEGECEIDQSLSQIRSSRASFYSGSQ